MRSEGELVYFGEPIRICDLGGSFVHSNSKKLPPEGRAAAALSRPTPTAVYSAAEGDSQTWRLHLFQAWQPHLEAVLKAGDLLRLFHVEDEAFLVGQVSDASLRVRNDLALDDNINEKLSALYGRLFREREATFADPRVVFVGLRRTKVKRSTRIKRSTCSVWEVQLESGSSGGPICFGAKMRLRHFASGAYLAFRAPRLPPPAALASGVGAAKKPGLEHIHEVELEAAMGKLSSAIKPVLLAAIDAHQDKADTLFTFEFVSVSETSVVGSSSGSPAPHKESSGSSGGSGNAAHGPDDAASRSHRSKLAVDSEGHVLVTLLSLGQLKHVATGHYVTSRPTSFTDLVHGQESRKTTGSNSDALPGELFRLDVDTLSGGHGHQQGLQRGGRAAAPDRSAAAAPAVPAATDAPVPTSGATEAAAAALGPDQAKLGDALAGEGLHPDLHQAPLGSGGSRWKRVKEEVLGAVESAPDEGAFEISAVQAADLDTFFFLRTQTNVVRHLWRSILLIFSV
jgi:hypothetical protein